MVSNWSVRDELLRVTHNWPIPVLAFLIGSIIGWGLSYLLPVTYQAEVILLVAYDDARECRNPDDCKNWQLEQTDALARSEFVLEPTLNQLRAVDPSWQDVSTKELAEMLNVLWRNAGQWRFVATSNGEEISKSAVEVWTQVFINEYQAAQENSLRLIDLNAQLRALNQTKVRLEQKLLILEMVKNEVRDFQNSLAGLNQNEQLDELTRWELFNVTALASSNSSAWLDLLESIPGELASISEYITWLDMLTISINQEIESIQLQLDQMEVETDKLIDQIAVASESSHGLTRSIRVSRMVDGEPLLIETRRSTSAAVIGGVIGLLVWGMVWITIPIWRSKK